MNESVGEEQRLELARIRPALDLLARIDLTSPRRICDLGCGAGRVTALLVGRWPQAEVTGVGESYDALERAELRLPSVQWIRADIAQWRPPQPYDLIFSSGALQWVRGHEWLLPALADSLPPNGVLAVQVPDNFDALSHTAIAETVLSGPWREQLAPLLGAMQVTRARDYFEMLRSRLIRIDVWQTEYLHVLDGTNPVKDWIKAASLGRFLDALGSAEAAAFEQAYAERVRIAYPPMPDGRTLFPFRRIFLVGRRAT